MSNVEIPQAENLVELFEASVKRFASQPLFGQKNAAGTGYDWVTYQQVAERVDHLRGGLASLGVGKGDGVAIIANNRVEWAVACYATYGLAARFIPMYEAELERIWKYIIDDSGSRILLVSTPEIYEQVKGFVDEIVKMNELRSYMVAFARSSYQNPHSICPHHQMMLPRIIKV